MKNITVVIYLLFYPIFVVSCATISGVVDYGSVAAGYYVEGRKAELQGDSKKALEYYKKSLDWAKGKAGGGVYSDTVGYVPPEYLPAGGGTGSRLEYNVISDAYQRVYNTVSTFESIVACNVQGDSDCVVKKGKHYINKYRRIAGARWEEIESLVLENESTLARLAAEAATVKIEKEFLAIKNLNLKEDFESIISQGKEYVEKHRNIKGSKWEEMESYVAEAETVKIEKEFLAIKNLNLKEDFESIISQGREYIEKHRNIKGSKWEEMESYVAKAETVKIEKEFLAIKNLNLKEDFESIISQGKKYIEKHRNTKGSRWEEIEKYINDAYVVKKEREREKEFQNIMSLNRDTDYEAIILRGKDYIEKYRNIAGNQWEEMVNLVNKAEQRKKQVEEETRKAKLQEMTRLNKVLDYGLVIDYGTNYLSTYGSDNEADTKRVQKLIKEAEIEKKKQENSPDYNYAVKKYKAQELRIHSAREVFLKIPYGDEFQRRKSAQKIENEKEKLLSYEGLYYDILKESDFNISDYDFKETQFSIKFGLRLGNKGMFGIAPSPDVLQIADHSGTPLSFNLTMDTDKAESFSKKQRQGAKLLVIYKLLRVEQFTYYNPLKAQAFRGSVSGYESDVRAYIKPYYIALITKEKKYILLKQDY